MIEENLNKKGLIKMANKGTPTKNNVKEGGLLKKWFDKTKDDKGLFQGGMKKRFLGRTRDKIESATAGKKRFEREAIKIESGVPGAPPSPDGDSLSSKSAPFSRKQKSQYSEDLREQESLTSKAGYNMYDKNRTDNPNFGPRVELAKDDSEWEIPAYSEEFSYARKYALDFDVTDKKQVAEMQRRLNNAGFSGANGKELAVDGMLGEQTVSALKAMQSDMLYESAYAKELLKNQRKQSADQDQVSFINSKIQIDRKKNEALQNRTRSIDAARPMKPPE